MSNPIQIEENHPNFTDSWNGKDSILDSVFDSYGDEDVEMADLEDGELVEENPNIVTGEITHLSNVTTTADVAGEEKGNDNLGPRKNKKKNKKNKKKRGTSGSSVTDINRFVIDVCKRLKERKSYLVWAAVGCLGVDALNELVKEVDAIQACGGQKTADEKRYRFGGGILWRILKARDLNAYKEIMRKGKEFEKQFKPQNVKQESVLNTRSSMTSTCTSIVGASDSSQQPSLLQNHLQTPKAAEQRVSVHDRVRIPVTYDDLVVEEDPEKCGEWHILQHANLFGCPGL